jgi:hypothetical protein
MSRTWNVVHTEKCGQFDIYFSWAHEDDYSFRDHFPDDTEDELAEMERKIERRDMTWFMAKVTADKCGIELASDIIGGCLYADPLDFVKDNDYYADMKENVIEQASVKLVELFTYKEEV